MMNRIALHGFDTETDYYVLDSTEVENFKPDVTVIASKKYLKDIIGCRYEEDKYLPPTASDWYPRCNSYYPYTEDVDAIHRVEHLQAAKKFLESFTTIKPDNHGKVDPYSEYDSQLNYLKSKPVTFLILGKPGIGEDNLGRLLASYWKCIYIDPEILIKEEIESGTRAGQCIEFNLRCGRAVAADVVLRLLEKRLKSKATTHRGYVICGFPLIKNDMFQEDPLSSESAVFTVQDIFEEILEPIGESVSEVIRNVSFVSGSEGGEGEEEMFENVPTTESILEPDIGSTSNDMCKMFDIGSNYAAQTNFLFTLCHEPLIIIYIMCPNYDVVTKHEHYRYNMTTDEMVNLLRDQTEGVVYTIYTTSPGFDTEELPDDAPLFPETSGVISASEMNYLLYLPRNFSGNVQKQLEDYRYLALPTIEKHVLLHDPQYFIKVDGRLTPNKMFNVVQTRLRLLPIPSVVIPEILIEPEIPVIAEGGAVEPILDYSSKSPLECFDQLRKMKIIGKMFKTNWSRWGIMCPVAMKDGLYIPGRTQFCVKFLNKIFCISEEHAMMRFIRNPRPYLLPPFPKPPCKIFVIGPPVSGKSAVAKSVALFLDGKVLDTFTLQTEYCEKMNKQYKENVRNDAMNEALAILINLKQEEYMIKLQDQENALQSWKNEVMQVLSERIHLESAQMDEGEEEDPLTPLQPIKELSEQYEVDLEEIRSKMIDLEIPELLCDDTAKCQDILEGISSIEEYCDIPARFKEIIPEPEPPSIFDEFVVNFADERVSNTLNLPFDSNEDFIDMYVSAIKETEDKNIDAGLYHGGWVVDGMLPEPEVIDGVMQEFYPYEILVLIDNSQQYLQERYKLRDQNIYQDYNTFFEKVNKPEIAMKVASITTTFSYKTRLARGILNQVLETKEFDGNETTHGEEGEFTDIEDTTGEFVDEDYFLTHATRLEIREYERALYKFNLKTDTLLVFLEDSGVPYHIVELSYKPLEDVMKYVIKHIDSRYQYSASQMTPIEKLEEIEDFGETIEAAEGTGEEAAQPSGDPDAFVKNRRLGTSIFCPVTYSNHWVLWKGKEEFACKYNDYVYLIATEDSMNDFIKSPLDYVLNKAPEKIPPPRICVVGVPGSGKTVLARSLHRHLGLYYLCYDELLKRVFNKQDDPREMGLILTEMKDSPEGLIVQNYLDNDEPFTEETRKLLNIDNIWFEEPKRSTGFVFDAFPRRPSDFAYIKQHCLIPDIVIQISCTGIEINRRRVQKLFHDWQVIRDEQREENERIYVEEYTQWEILRKTRIDELMESKRQERYQKKLTEEKKSPDVGEDELQSQVSFDSVAEAADLNEATRTADSEYPEPKLIIDEESEEDALQRFIDLAQREYVTFSDYFRILQENCAAELIDWISIDGDLSEEKVFSQALIIIDKIKFRNKSVMQRCYDINLDTAEDLISTGHYFLSRFGRACPVQLYDLKNTIHMFLPMEQRFEIYPLLHGYFIYFLTGKLNRQKFIDNPLKYIWEADANFPIVPFRVAIIGPPKSGKTDLAERFKNDLGMKYISIGQAARYVLRNLPFSKLAKDMEAVLRKGWELTSEMTMKCVEAMAFDPRGQTQGLVFDGFPNSKYDVMHLAERGLIPHLVLYLDADKDDMEDYRLHDRGRRGLPVFGKAFIEHRRSVWDSGVDQFTDWFDKEYQIYTKIQVKNCKWSIWDTAYKIAVDVLYEVKSYFKNCHRDMALHIANMQVTPAEFLKRQSISFKHYCPVCLHYDNHLINGGMPPDRTGLIQYKQNFYWVCRKHMKEFADEPASFLTPYNKHQLPADLPEALHLDHMPDNVYEDGYCIVCFWDGQPSRLLNKGILDYAVLFREIYYLFDTQECLDIFMSDPFTYFQKKIGYKGNSCESFSLEKLSIQGYVEQYIIRDIVKAVTRIGTVRPVVAGLGIEKSALIGLGLYLKVQNQNATEESREMYKQALELFRQKRFTLMNYIAKIKKSINPYLHYEEPLEPLVFPEYKIEGSSTSGELKSLTQQIMDYMQPGDYAGGEYDEG
ncbi:adenylate kinase 9-like [Onthophagus taurus]|uniref:adenylate kinase 9-like n=1 Tax=Onthophagus taurus TaxID=166361 RepID=UPI0039BDDF0F